MIAKDSVFNYIFVKLTPLPSCYILRFESFIQMLDHIFPGLPYLDFVSLFSLETFMNVIEKSLLRPVEWNQIQFLKR